MMLVQVPFYDSNNLQIGLLGPNGAGKTTITNMIRGEIRPDHGAVYIRGVEVHADTQAALRHIGGMYVIFGLLSFR